jgi:hypothetical protein
LDITKKNALAENCFDRNYLRHGCLSKTLIGSQKGFGSPLTYHSDRGPPNKNIDVGENMIRVHKSTNSKDAQMASASLNTVKRHFNFSPALINNFLRLTVKKLFVAEL